MFAEAYIKTASEIIDVYKPQLPLAVFLKQYFRLNKKFGSRDRKIITSLLYGYFRLGVQPEYITRRMHIILGSFLSGELPILFYQKTCNEVCAYYSLSFDDKRSFVEKKYHVRFSLPYKLSEGVNEDDYFRYLFRPANVFIRIRKNQSAIIQKLLNSNIPFKQISSTCLAFNQNIKLNEILGETDEYVIQDYSSQLTATLFPSIQTGAWWDCCAASGGKSLLLFDHNQHIQLDISDIRKSIIEQLKYRLHQYHFQPNKIFIHDARQALKGNKKYHSVLLDAPCSGSGTWSRSPEQFYYFQEDKLNEFKKLQKAILEAVSKSANHAIYYMTCSVFAEENEQLIRSFEAQYFRVKQIKAFNTFELGGDHIFACQLEKKD